MGRCSIQTCQLEMIRIIVSRWQVCKGVVGEANAGETQFPLDDWNGGCCKNHRLPARSFRQNAMHRLRRCIIAPLSKSQGFSPRPLSSFFFGSQSAYPASFVRLLRERGRSKAPSHHRPSEVSALSKRLPTFRHECKGGAFSRLGSASSFPFAGLSPRSRRLSISARQHRGHVSVFQVFHLP